MEIVQNFVAFSEYMNFTKKFRTKFLWFSQNIWTLYFWMIVKSYQLFNPFNHLLIQSTFGTLHLQNVLERAIWRGSTFSLKEISSTYKRWGMFSILFAKYVILTRNITWSKLFSEFLHIFCSYSIQLLFLGNIHG